MSPQTAKMLEEEIYPIVKSVIPKSIKPVGCEDHEELVQDTMASAAMMLDSMERSGKTPKPRSIAYYSIQRTRQGRRANGFNVNDVLGAFFLMNNPARVYSLDATLDIDESGNETSLYEMLAAKKDDAAELCAKKLDWADFLERQPVRNRSIIMALACGTKEKDIARNYKLSPPRITQIKKLIADAIKEFMGVNILHEASAESTWERDMRALCEHGEWQHFKISEEEAWTPPDAHHDSPPSWKSPQDSCKSHLKPSRQTRAT